MRTFGLCCNTVITYLWGLLVKSLVLPRLSFFKVTWAWYGAVLVVNNTFFLACVVVLLLFIARFECRFLWEMMECGVKYLELAWKADSLLKWELG